MVPGGFRTRQRAPFFEMQTDAFALLAIDTGVLRQIDPEQRRWLEAALQRAAGKTTMAIVGHPFFAGGYDTTTGDVEFTRLKRLLLDHGVTIMMAGDTHDLEYYLERRGRGLPDVYNFVNGDVMRNRFHLAPAVQAAELLLQERIPRNTAALAGS